ncbi:MAG: hypothetical protein J2P15_07330 [Micromonosporaceae bacterium]|nr:hypothetical protein [Micromonosporaceae bacterium]
MAGPVRPASEPISGGWRQVPALAAPITVYAARAPRPVAGLPVHTAGFVSATTGWAAVGSYTPPSFALLRTEDGGVTWTSQLAWPGTRPWQLQPFDTQQAALVFGLWPTVANVINGQPVAAGQPPHPFLAGTQDAGQTWTLRSPPDPQAGGVHFLSPAEIWVLISVPGAYPRTDAARSADGGASWSRVDGAGDLPLIRVRFFSPRDGMLIAEDRLRADILYRTSDGGHTWNRQHLAPPPRLPPGAMTQLYPVGPDLLMLSAVSPTHPASRPRPRWEGSYGYQQTKDGWADPIRLPMPPADNGPDLLVPAPDRRLWGGCGHDLWVSDDLAGPWRHLPVPLPDEEHISGICPVGDGVLWIVTNTGVAGGGLYRSDDGAHWNRLTVAAT